MATFLLFFYFLLAITITATCVMMVHNIIKVYRILKIISDAVNEQTIVSIGEDTIANVHITSKQMKDDSH